MLALSHLLAYHGGTIDGGMLPALSGHWTDAAPGSPTVLGDDEVAAVHEKHSACMRGFLEGFDGALARQARTSRT
jgi:hypothetical protein